MTNPVGFDKEIDKWHRLGPVKYRLREMLFFLLLPVVWLVVLLSGQTLISFYQGTGSVHLGPPERPAVAEVDECHRLGPISADGFGYWWECQVVVRTADGRVMEVPISRSIVTPDDIGQEVEFREACWGDNNTKCAYGRPVSIWWGLLAAAFDKVLWFSTIAWAVVILGYLGRAVLGAPRFFAVLRRFSR